MIRHAPRVAAGKMESAIRRPHEIYPFLRELATERLPIWWLQQRADDARRYRVTLDGYDLLVDLHDGGIGQDLALQGIREPHSSRPYRALLRELDAAADEGITVLEVGANIGYYALLPAVECSDVTVHAAEVDQANAARLRTNIALNDAGDAFADVGEVALGDHNGEVELQRSEHSNRHSCKESFRESNVYATTETAPIRRGADWLADRDVAPADIDVLRMDVEGYEARVLAGLPGLDPDLVHLEVHRNLLDDEELDAVIEWFRDRQLEPVAAGQCQTRQQLADYDELREHNYLEVVAAAPSSHPRQW